MASSRLAALLAAAALAVPAFAQPPAPPQGADSSHRGWEARRGEMAAWMEAHHRQREADVALLLRLRPDQQPAFQAWEAAVRPPRGEGLGLWGREGGKRGGEGAAPSTTPQALDRMQARMAEHEARSRTKLDATRRLYAALSPEQQPLFDALMRLHHAHGGEHHGWGGHGHGEMEPPPAPGA